MKKIGILHGMERSFPEAFVERVNKLGLKDIMAEPVMVDMVQQGVGDDYAVIIDRISQDVPFYRAYLKNAAIDGTSVLNNPFWWSADEKFFNNALAVKIGVAVPNTVILPSHERPADTSDASFSNLKYPLSWEKIFNYIGWPAYMKPHSGGGWKSVYKLNNLDEFFKAYAETNQLVMMLQEEIIFDDYFRCYCLDRKHVRIMQYEPRNPHDLRYVVNKGPASEKLLMKVHTDVLALNNALGYDFNTVEMAVRNGIPYAIDFCNPAPDADVKSVGQENFEWVVEHAAKMAVERAQAQKPGKDNLTWGTFVSDAVNKPQVAKASGTAKVAKPSESKTKKAAPKKK
jgi:glutathione synthase/RimK-type ligase-like ATP-grasp enzyme